MPEKYSIEDKMAGRDLHGLPCRVPKPNAAQASCSHTRRVWVDDEDTGGRYVEISACEDIPGTNNFRCLLCGYTRRY